MIVFNIMESLIILLITGIAMGLFAIPVIAISAALDADHKKKELRKYARQQIMQQMERERELGNQSKNISP